MMKFKSLFRRGPSKSALHRGDPGRGRNRSGAAAAVGAQSEVGSALPPAVGGGSCGAVSVGAAATNREEPSIEHQQQLLEQQRAPPQRQLGRRKAVPPTLQKEEVMVGKEEEEEGGRVEERTRMEAKKEEDMEEDCNVESGGGGRSPLEKQVLALGLEKCALESRLEEVLRDAEANREEVEHLRKEVAALKCQRSADLDALEEENRVLRERLRELASGEGKATAATPEASALSDAEKEQLLLSRSSSGQAISTETMGASTEHPAESGGANVSSENALCSTPEWDKQSSSSLSEVSVACLQDRILQMEETHYSTNEELQATLQELADLQAQLTDLQAENERLSEEKSVLLESLCRQTEKLEDTRSRADTLQELLLGAPQSSSLPSDPLDGSNDATRETALANGGGDGPELGECSDREAKLVELLKSAQEERENLLSRLEDLNVQLEEAREAWSSRGDECERLQDRVRLLESAVEAANAERRELEKELAASKEESSARQIQISRLSTLLDNARAKIEELEQAREVRDKCELDNLLDNARKEKDALECQVASLQEQLSHSQCEVTRLKDSVCSLQEECKVARNNAKSALSDLEYQLEQGRSEMALLAEEVRRQTEEAAGACAQSQRHLEDKRTLKAALSEAQRATLEAERKLMQLKVELEEEKKIKEEQREEWERFQSDLLVTVRVANDFKNEAKVELEKYVLENRGLKDKIKILEAEVEKLKGTTPNPPDTLTTPLIPLSNQPSPLSTPSSICLSPIDSPLSEGKVFVFSSVQSGTSSHGKECGTKRVARAMRSPGGKTSSCAGMAIRSLSANPAGCPINGAYEEAELQMMRDEVLSSFHRARAKFMGREDGHEMSRSARSSNSKQKLEKKCSVKQEGGREGDKEGKESSKKSGKGKKNKATLRKSWSWTKDAVVVDISSTSLYVGLLLYVLF